MDYPKERERGYDATEDLLVPGYFEMPIKKGESIIFTASLKEKDPKMYAPIMEAEIESLDRRDSFYHCLVNAAHQFHVQKEYFLVHHTKFLEELPDCLYYEE